MPYGAPGVAPPGGNKNRNVLVIVGVVVAAVVLLPVVSILAVTLLGKQASPKFSSVSSAIDDGPTTTAPWSTYTDPVGGFSVELPAQGSSVALPADQIPAGMNMYAAQTVKGANVYAVYVYDIPTSPSGNVAGGLEGGVRGSITGMGGTVDRYTPTTRPGAQVAATFDATVPQLNGTLTGVGFVTESGRFVQVFSAGRSPSAAEVERIASSFTSTR